jgi:hypothetical protein
VWNLSKHYDQIARRSSAGLIPELTMVIDHAMALVLIEF